MRNLASGKTKPERTMAELIKIYPENPDPRRIEQVVEVLRRGGLVIYPTDTVYGLGCDIGNYKAVEALCRLKHVKPETANFSFICSDLINLSMYARQIDTPTFKILKRLLPGPYTFILPAGPGLPKAFKGKKTVGIRVPDNNIPREIVRALGNPIISTSVYDTDEILEYTTDPSLIAERMDTVVDLVIDGGYGGNIASTVISLVDGHPQVLRQGAGPADEFL